MQWGSSITWYIRNGGYSLVCPHCGVQYVWGRQCALCVTGLLLYGGQDSAVKNKGNVRKKPYVKEMIFVHLLLK